MIRLAAIAAGVSCGLCGLATSTLATEWIACSSPDGGASMDILVGSVDVLSIAGMTVTVGGQRFTREAEVKPGRGSVVVVRAF